MRFVCGLLRSKRTHEEVMAKSAPQDIKILIARCPDFFTTRLFAQHKNGKGTMGCGVLLLVLPPKTLRNNDRCAFPQRPSTYRNIRVECYMVYGILAVPKDAKCPSMIEKSYVTTI